LSREMRIPKPSTGAPSFRAFCEKVGFHGTRGETADYSP
jgi:hypothetical protein